uniref:RRM domain-containing protein n=1 Tax=Brassica oleracea TaxID=3712 RepID=A0A3P6D5A6_BRAOL|nr:unnamed protein product [Brassica oleracea]
MLLFLMLRSLIDCSLFAGFSEFARIHNMAFLSKVGRIFRQTSNYVTVSNSILQSISSSKIFVGGISYSTDEFGLREAFSKYGQVVDAKIIVDRETGRSRGFAFVTFTSNQEATNAMQLDRQAIYCFLFSGTQHLHGRRIRVNFATERGSGFGGRRFGGPSGGAVFYDDPLPCGYREEFSVWCH